MIIKAMLIVTALTSGGNPLTSGAPMDYTVEMPTMKSCLEARKTIAKQDSSVKTLCIPRTDVTEKVLDIFSIFNEMIDRCRCDDDVEEWRSLPRR